MPRPAPAAPAASEAKIQRLLARVRDRYALGQQANRTTEITTTDLAKTHGLAESNVRKAKAFARGYTPEELELFCQCRRPNGLPLHWGHVIWLLTVKDGAERRRWEVKAAEHGWSAPDLRIKLRRSRKPKPLAHGGRLRKPANLEMGLLQLIYEGRRWAARSKLVITDDVRGRAANRRKLLAEATEAFHQLKNAAEQAIERLAAWASSGDADRVGRSAGRGAARRTAGRRRVVAPRRS